MDNKPGYHRAPTKSPDQQGTFDFLLLLLEVGYLSAPIHISSFPFQGSGGLAAEFPEGSGALGNSAERGRT